MSIARAAVEKLILSFPISMMGKKFLIVKVIKFTVNIFAENPIEIYKRAKFSFLGTFFQ